MQCDKAQTAENMTSIRTSPLAFSCAFQIRAEVVGDREGSDWLYRREEEMEEVRTYKTATEGHFEPVASLQTS